MARLAGILGCPGSGKTSLARALAHQAVEESGAPLLVVDTAHQEIFEDMYHASSVDEVLDIVWGEGDHCAYKPRDPHDFETLMGGVYGGRNVVLVVDELRNVIPPGTTMRANFRNCLSEHRRVLVAGFVTSQLYSDSGAALRGLSTEWYFFRMLEDQDKIDIRRHHQIPEEVIAALPSAKECFESGRPTSEAYVYKKVGF